MMVMSGEKQGNKQRDYYTGKHPKQLNVKDGDYDDNIAVNYTGLASARDNSRLFRGGIEFKLPDGATEQQELLDNIWDTNKQEQLLSQLALNGSIYGTPFVKIVPDGTVNRITGQPVARLIALDPEITRVESNPFDVDEAERYVIEFTIGEIGYREVTRKTAMSDMMEPSVDVPSTWIVEHFIMKKDSGKWEPDPDRPPMEWPYSFPPIHHWKNLPSLKADKGCHGSTDAEWALMLQDKLNFAESNINKTIRMNAAPPTIVTGIGKEPKMSTGPGSLSWFSTPETKVYNLQPNADINGSRAFAGDLQSSIFELMREVPPAVIAQLGSGLTNFVMRVIYSDALDKTDTKRELYGDAILEINRRLLVLTGFEGEQSNPGEIVWKNPLPENIMEDVQVDKAALDMGIIDHETVSQLYKSRYGKSWEDIKAALDAEKKATNALGGGLLRDFMAGRGQSGQPQTQQQPAALQQAQQNQQTGV
jgi:hypothetical protein